MDRGRRRLGVRVNLVLLGLLGAVFLAVKAERTAALDIALTLRIQGRRSRVLGRLMTAVSWPGFPPQSRIVPPAVIAGLWVTGHRLEARFEALAWGTALVSTVAKAAIRRDRPVPPRVRVVVAPLGGTSFPSGHVLTYVGVYGFLAYLSGASVAPEPLRRAAVASLAALVALIGPSRIYQGHHWPTDVLASYLIGFAYVEALAAAYDRAKGAAGEA